jgi:hypothetical protein
VTPCAGATTSALVVSTAVMSQLLYGWSLIATWWW